MNRKLTTIQLVGEVNPIPGAEFIEVVSVLGWHVVVRKGQFKTGDYCVFCEVDSVLTRAPWNEFLFKDDKTLFRVKTIRLRKQISQGICFSMDFLQPGVYSPGDDISELLGVVKYEEVIPAHLSGKKVSKFPGFLFKTDETRIQTVPHILEKYKDKTFYVSEKLDGSSCALFLRDDKFGVCSRNFQIDKEDNNAFWKAVKEHNLEAKLRELSKQLEIPNIAIQGELIGPGVQGNKYRLDNLNIYAFNLFNINGAIFIKLWDNQLLFNALGIKTVPLIETDKHLFNTVDEMVKFSENHSTLNPNIPMEGLIWRPEVETRDPHLGRLSFKCLNPNFLLKYD